MRLHPNNHNFTWQKSSARSLKHLTAVQLEQFNDDGFVKIENAFSASDLLPVTEAIDPIEREREDFVRKQEGARISISEADTITFTTQLVCSSPILRAFAAHPVIKDICHDLIGDDVRLYWDQAVYKKTGKKQEFPWHQDNGYTFIEPQQYLTLWIPLVDVAEDNGCPWIAPGIHKRGTLEHWITPIGLKCLDDVEDAVCVEANVGDIIAFSSLAPHRTGPNLRQSSVRKAYILQYAPDGAFTIASDGTRTLQNDAQRQFKILDKGQ